MMGTTSSITMQSLGKIAQCKAVGAKKNGVCFFFVGHAPSPLLTYLRSRGAQFEQALRCSLLPDFDAVCSVFSQVIPLSEALHSYHSRRQVAPQFSRNCGQKNAKSRKIVGKVCAHHFEQIAEVFEKNSTAVVQGEYVHVHLYKNFYASRYLVLTASVKFRISSRKTARNEQDCAHQKSYKK